MREQPTSYGQLEEEYFEINNKKEGIYKRYYENGMNEQSTTYDENKSYYNNDMREQPTLYGQ